MKGPLWQLLSVLEGRSSAFPWSFLPYLKCLAGTSLTGQCNSRLRLVFSSSPSKAIAPATKQAHGGSLLLCQS